MSTDTCPILSTSGKPESDSLFPVDVHGITALGQGLRVTNHAGYPSDKSEYEIMQTPSRRDIGPRRPDRRETSIRPFPLRNAGCQKRPTYSVRTLFQKFPIILTRKFLGGVAHPAKSQTIRMHINQCHAAMPDNPIEFPLPNIGGCFSSSSEKQRGILGQRVRHLHSFLHHGQRTPKSSIPIFNCPVPGPLAPGPRRGKSCPHRPVAVQMDRCQKWRYHRRHSDRAAIQDCAA